VYISDKQAREQRNVKQQFRKHLQISPGQGDIHKLTSLCSYSRPLELMRPLDKDQLADVMYGNNLCLLHESHESHKHHLATQRFFMLTI